MIATHTGVLGGLAKHTHMTELDIQCSYSYSIYELMHLQGMMTLKIDTSKEERIRYPFAKPNSKITYLDILKNMIDIQEFVISAAEISDVGAKLFKYIEFVNRYPPACNNGQVY